MKENWKTIKIPQNKRLLIWIFSKKENKPLVVIQTEPGEDLRFNFKEELITIETERI